MDGVSNQMTVGKATFTIPVVTASTEGRGNGIKTNINNMVEVSKKIRRHPAYCTKFMGVELGCQSTYDHQASSAVINGDFKVPILQEQLKKFIKQFVICPSCTSLETKITLSSGKKKEVFIKCKGCGKKSSVDQTHKVVKEIIKYPPGSELEEKVKGKREGKKNRRKGLKEEKEEEEEAPEPADASGEGRDGESAVSEAEMEARRKEKEAKKAEKARLKKEKKREAEAAEAEADAPKKADRAEREAIEIDCEAIAGELREKISADGMGPAGSWWGAQLESATYSLDEAMTCAFNGCFDENILRQIKPCKTLFTKMAGAPLFGSYLLQLAAALALRHPAVHKELGFVLKAFYDESLLADAPVLEWYEDLDSLELKRSVAPFVTCVKTAPDEDEGEDN